MGNRKGFVRYVEKKLQMMSPGLPHIKTYIDALNKLSDAEFDAYIDKLRTKKTFVHLTVPNGQPHAISVERNIAVAASMGHDFFEHLIITDRETGLVYRTPKKYMTMYWVYRRLKQMLIDKQATSEDSRHTDQLTDQPTGVSRAGKLSYPELQVLRAQGLKRSIYEVMSVRGGNRRAYNYMVRSLISTGKVSQEAIARLNTRPKVINSLSTWLRGQHLENTV